MSPFLHADEVWKGIEYHVAAHCIYEGLIEEGLAWGLFSQQRNDGVYRATLEPRWVLYRSG